jgi:AcrR family transcriptional regulator
MKTNGKAPSSNQSKQRRNRYDEIIQAALEIFAQKGYAATSVQDVADAVGVLKGSLYHYIDSKEDLLFHIFDDAHVEAEKLMAEVDNLDADPIEKLRFYLETSVRRTLENLPLQNLYFRDWRYLTGDRRDKLVERRRQYDRYLRSLIVRALEAAGLESSMNIRFVSSFVIGGTNWVADWYRADGPDSADEVAHSYAHLAMSAIMGAATFECASGQVTKGRSR